MKEFKLDTAAISFNINNLDILGDLTENIEKEEVKVYDKIPDGIYKCQISKAEVNMEKQTVCITYRIVEGEHLKKLLWVHYNLQKEWSIKRLIADLQKLQTQVAITREIWHDPVRIQIVLDIIVMQSVYYFNYIKQETNLNGYTNATLFDVIDSKYESVSEREKK